VLSKLHVTLSEILSLSVTSSQQAASYVTKIDQNCFEKNGQCYSIYGFEYKPGFDDGYIQWIADNKKSWYMTSASLVADPVAAIDRRPIPQEPLYLIVNLGQSANFVPEISPLIEYPVTMYVDYIRVYQPKGQHNVGCSPKDFPTADYINKYVFPRYVYPCY
jgi:beta-glucan synthesis-associated protein KRE6